MTSKADLRRYDALQRYGCVACRIDGYHSPGDIHHIVDKGYRKHSGGNQSTIPLCPWHHRGVPPMGHTNVTASHSFGWSMALNPRQFKLKYGEQRFLLDKVNREIALP
jgi:hypothetical protein